MDIKHWNKLPEIYKKSYVIITEIWMVFRLIKGKKGLRDIIKAKRTMAYEITILVHGEKEANGVIEEVNCELTKNDEDTTRTRYREKHSRALVVSILHQSYSFYCDL